MRLPSPDAQSLRALRMCSRAGYWLGRDERESARRRGRLPRFADLLSLQPDLAVPTSRSPRRLEHCERRGSATIAGARSEATFEPRAARAAFERSFRALLPAQPVSTSSARYLAHSRGLTVGEKRRTRAARGVGEEDAAKGFERGDEGRGARARDADAARVGALYAHRRA